ncbi:MAG: hypothetical protein ACO1OK_06530 [Devosia sp.]
MMAGDADIGRLPTHYLEYPEAFAFWEISRRHQAALDADDLKFAVSADALVQEGPWGNLPARWVAYVGILPDGQRTRLARLHGAWRYVPGHAMPLEPVGPQTPIIRRIALIANQTDSVIGAPYGEAPVQSEGWVDGKAFYFRARGNSWQMRIGATNSVNAPEWYFEESWGEWPDAGRMNTDQACALIEKAFSLFRSGTASMQWQKVGTGKDQ